MGLIHVYMISYLLLFKLQYLCQIKNPNPVKFNSKHLNWLGVRLKRVYAAASTLAWAMDWMYYDTTCSNPICHKEKKKTSYQVSFIGSLVLFKYLRSGNA